MKPLIIQINLRPYALAAAIASFALGGTHASGGETSVAPADMRRIGTIDERFQSFNVEMVEVTGGRFWKPYSARDDPANPLKTTSPAVAVKSDLFAKRSPIDLADARLRRFASALSPAYLRISGTWANTTFFADSDHPPTKPPAGYKDVLTRRQWRDVIDFSLAIDAPIVTSFAISPGTRDARGVWNPEQARRLVLATQLSTPSIFSPSMVTTCESSPCTFGRPTSPALLARRADGIHLALFGQGEIGPDLFKAACDMMLEGLISKRRDSRYRAGRDWIKVKNPKSPAMNRARTRSREVKSPTR